MKLYVYESPEGFETWENWDNLCKNTYKLGDTYDIGEERVYHSSDVVREEAFEAGIILELEVPDADIAELISYPKHANTVFSITDIQIHEPEGWREEQDSWDEHLEKLNPGS